MFCQPLFDSDIIFLIYIDEFSISPSQKEFILFSLSCITKANIVSKFNWADLLMSGLPTSTVHWYNQ